MTLLEQSNKVAEALRDGVSIGDVAKATGIGVYTLRMWERRYGAPFSAKRESGHRRYHAEEIARLRLVKTLLDAGHKPSKVVALSEEALKELVEGLLPTGRGNGDRILHHTLESIKNWDDKHLLMRFEEDWNALGPVGFAGDRASQLLTRVGHGWVTGEISIAQEHFVSELLEGFLEKKWRRANTETGGRPVLLTSAPGENHSLGLHMCAIVLTAAGHKVLFLGPSAPLPEIVQTAAINHCQMVCLSFSDSYGQDAARGFLGQMKAALPAGVELVAGGGSAPKRLPRVSVFPDLRSFYDWLVNRKAEAPTDLC